MSAKELTGEVNADAPPNEIGRISAELFRKRLTVRYIAGLALIATTVVFSMGLTRQRLQNRLEDAEFINRAGAQRMLSQKISKDCLLLSHSETFRSGIQTDLRLSLEKWQTTHELLKSRELSIHGSPGYEVELTLAFERLQPHFDGLFQIASEFSRGDAQARKNPSETIDAMLLHESRYLENMHAIVDILSRESTNQLEDHRQLALILLVFAPSVIVLAGVFVFRRTVAMSAAAYAATSELTGQLHRRQHKIKRLNHTLSAMAKVTAHDVRENLRKIQMFSQLAQEIAAHQNHPGLEELHDFLGIVARNAAVVTERIATLHEIATISGTVEAPSAVDLESNILSAWKRLDPALVPTRATIDCQLRDTVLAREKQLRDLWLMLLDNCLRHNPTHPLTITIRSKRVENYSEISIEDDGTSAKKEDLLSAFEPLLVRDGQKGSESSYRTGLSHALLIATHNDGELTCRILDSGGVQVCVRLPIAPTAQQAAAPSILAA